MLRNIYIALGKQRKAEVNQHCIYACNYQFQVTFHIAICYIQLQIIQARVCLYCFQLCRHYIFRSLFASNSKMRLSIFQYFKTYFEIADVHYQVKLNYCVLNVTFYHYFFLFLRKLWIVNASFQLHFLFPTTEHLHSYKIH